MLPIGLHRSREMGRAHVLLDKGLKRRIEGNPELDAQVIFLSEKDFDEQGNVICLVASGKLPDGYNGQYDLVLDNGIVSFKKDADIDLR